MENKIYSVAIDGPAGVGKSTVSKMLAEKLGWNCLDTGALYRAVTAKCIELGIDCADENVVKNAIKNIKVTVQYMKKKQRTFVNGEDFTSKLRSTIVDKNVAFISRIPEVRESIKGLQRQIATENNVVVEGRDIGSVVLKNSVNKFYLTASAEVRAERRYKQKINAGLSADKAEILADIIARDKMDSERVVSPLKISPDAILIDTGPLSQDTVVKRMFINTKKPKKIIEKTL